MVKVFKPQKTFLVIGSVGLCIGLATLAIKAWPLAMLWAPIGPIVLNFYYAYRLTLTDSGISIRNFFWKERVIKFKQLIKMDSTNYRTLILETNVDKVKMFDVFQDRRYITDYIIKRVDQSRVSLKILNEWDKYFIFYVDE